VHPYLTHKFSVDAGIFFPDRRIKMSAEGSTGTDPTVLIDFNEEFRVKESDQTFALDFGWRFGEKWSLLGQYFDLSGGSQLILEEDVEWEDVIFQAGTGIAVGNEFTLTRLFFGRSFDSPEHYEFGIGAGIHLLRIGAMLKGTAIVDGVVLVDHLEAESVEGPLPNIGVFYKYSFSPRFAFRGRLDWLDAKVGRYDGEMINLSLGMNYQITDHLGVGLNYNDFQLDVIIDKSDWRGRVDLGYEGAYVYLSAYW
jgi:hypothetical protein